MSDRLRLFKYRKAYDHPGSDGLFAKALSESVAYHAKHCPDYERILQLKGFDAEKPLTIEQIAQIPPIATLFLKQHELNSMPPEKMILSSTTSGTSGKPVRVGLDKSYIHLSAYMLWRLVRFHKLSTLRPSRHIVLGFQPSKHSQMGAIRTAYATTWLAPSVSKVYALRDTGDSYELNIEAIGELIEQYSKGKLPVRFIGFPAFLYTIIRTMQAQGIRLQMPAHSKVLLGGGWKHSAETRVDKNVLFALVQEHLGIQEKDIKEVFGVVEHPVPFFACERRHFHVPIYSRVLIRDPLSLEVLPYGEPGLLNLVSPLISSMPLLSIMTDDVATLHAGSACGCGIEAPWFDPLGRAGLDSIQTCTAKVGEML